MLIQIGSEITQWLYHKGERQGKLMGATKRNVHLQYKAESLCALDFQITSFSYPSNKHCSFKNKCCHEKVTSKQSRVIKDWWRLCGSLEGSCSQSQQYVSHQVDDSSVLQKSAGVGWAWLSTKENDLICHNKDIDRNVEAVYLSSFWYVFTAKQKAHFTYLSTTHILIEYKGK